MPHPDEKNHPVATGLAKHTVDAHQDEQDIVLWSAWFCPFNQRTWMTLEERNIPYQYHEVNPYKKGEDFLKVNPLGLVPALEHKGKGALYESDVLVEYLEDLYPDSPEHPSIFPSDTFEKSWARLNIQHISKASAKVGIGNKIRLTEQKIIPHYFALQQHQDPEDQAKAREDLYSGLRLLTDRVKGPYFAGEKWTAVDMSLAPFVARFYNLEKYRDLDHSAISDKWVAYKDQLLARESLKKTSSEDKYYEELLARYLKNEAQSEVAKATRGGKGMP